MGAIRIGQFSGIAPKIAATELPPNMAQASVNAKTWGRSLRPFRTAAFISSLSKTGTIQTLYRYLGTDWLHWTQDVDVARNAIAGDTIDKLFYTGTDYPRATSSVLWNVGSPGTSLPPASYLLGIPAPPDTPTSAASGVGVLTGDYQWVYTYARHWSDGTVDEGPPSSVSTELTLASQQATVTMPNTTAPTFADYGITHKRIYRLIVGDAGATYDYVTEVAAAATTYADNIADTALGSVITTTSFDPPPSDMQGLLALPNGVYVGFSGNTLLCSDPYHPHAYPLANRYGMATDIIGIGAFDTSVVVCGDNYTWVANVVDPTAVTMQRLADSRPCSSKRSIVSSPMGVMFSTQDGIVLAGPGGYDLLTKFLFDRDHWQDYQPSTIHGHWLEGRYVGFWGGSGGGCFVLDMAGVDPTFSPVNVTGSAAVIIASEDVLYFVDYATNSVNQWEGDVNSNLSYDWTSKTFIVPVEQNFAYGKIEANYGAGLTAAQQAAITAANDVVIAANLLLLNDDLEDYLDGHYIGEGSASISDDNDHGAIDGDIALGVLQATNLPDAQVGFKLYGNEALIYNGTILGATPFPLPSGSLRTRFYVELSGNVETYSVAIANDADELAGGA